MSRRTLENTGFSRKFDFYCFTTPGDCGGGLFELWRNMLNNTGFDQWADEYDRSVARSDAAGSYPFAGYQEILDEIVRQVTEHGGGDVLDIGFGTGALSLENE